MITRAAIITQTYHTSFTPKLTLRTIKPCLRQGPLNIVYIENSLFRLTKFITNWLGQEKTWSLDNLEMLP